MRVDRRWLEAEAVRQGFALSEEDLEVIGTILETTRAALARARVDSAEWQDPPVGFLPPAAD
jgi:DNA-binding GntR family transcriptional regulator